MRGQRLAIVLLLGTLCVSCATKGTIVVLVPDARGHTGHVTVSTEAGVASLSEAGQAVVIAAPATKPGDPYFMSEKKREGIFQDALAVEPEKPLVFNLYFKSDSDRMTADSLSLLKDVVKAAAERDSRDISINGHTDRSGDADYNMRLSNARAHAVRAHLLELGIAPTSLSLAYFGEGDPLVPTADNVHEARNRRVEIVVR